MIKKVTLILLLLIGNFTFAQYKSTKLKMAESLLEEGKYYAALQIYEDLSKSDGDNKDAYKKIAELHERLYNYEEAAKWYYELFEIHDGEYPKSEYKFAELMKIKGNYKVALEHFESFRKSYQGHDKMLYNKLCKDHITSCKEAMEALPNAELSIQKIESNINSTYTDLSPFASGGHLYFASIPSDSSITYQGFLDSAPTFQIYKSKYLEDDLFDSTVLFIPEIINKPYYHTSNPTFSQDGKTLLFTRCKKNINGKNICKIYYTQKNDSSWSEPKALGDEINDRNNNFSSTHPVLMEYEKPGRSKEMVKKLIFASDMSGGEGGYDLWECELANDFTCEKPTNLGRKINTPLNELTPFYSANEDKLYFSSNGLGGYGGLDVFYANLQRGRVRKVYGADLPINSSYDDWYYSKMNNNTAFICSNRKGAKVYYKNTRLDDIFLIKKETKKYLALYSVTNDTNQTAIQGTIFKVKFSDDPNGEGKEVKEGDFFQVIPNKSYLITAQKNGYINESTIFSTSYDTKSDTLKWVFELQAIYSINGIEIPNLYFDANSAEIKPESKQALNKLYKMLIDNPTLSIEIGAHTDQDGSAEYNLGLSQQRAQAVVNYLTNKRISVQKLRAKGYGKSQPVSELPEKNRRIVFKVIKDVNLEKTEQK